MQRISDVLHTNQDVATAHIWPVWRDSFARQVSFTPKSRKNCANIWHKARKWDQRTRSKGKHGGIIGRAALSVLYTLLNDFLNFKTGRLDPSIKSISEKAGVCERTCHTALQRLRSLKILDWIRRCSQSQTADGRFALRQDTNAYEVHEGTRWGPADLDPPPPPTRDTLGYPTTVAEPLARSLQALKTGNQRTAFQDLMSDQGDRLAVALAQLGRAMGAI